MTHRYKYRKKDQGDGTNHCRINRSTNTQVAHAIMFSFKTVVHQIMVSLSSSQQGIKECFKPSLVGSLKGTPSGSFKTPGEFLPQNQLAESSPNPGQIDRRSEFIHFVHPLQLPDFRSSSVGKVPPPCIGATLKHWCFRGSGPKDIFGTLRGPLVVDSKLLV